MLSCIPWSISNKTSSWAQYKTYCTISDTFCFRHAFYSITDRRVLAVGWGRSSDGGIILGYLVYTAPLSKWKHHFMYNICKGLILMIKMASRMHSSQEAKATLVYEMLSLFVAFTVRWYYWNVNGYLWKLFRYKMLYAQAHFTSIACPSHGKLAPVKKKIVYWILLRAVNGTGGRFKNTYELLNLRALKFSPMNKIHIFQCMGNIFCVEFQREPLKFHTKYLTHTL